jgi:hypothetical protein
MLSKSTEETRGIKTTVKKGAVVKLGSDSEDDGSADLF